MCDMLPIIYHSASGEGKDEEDAKCRNKLDMHFSKPHDARQFDELG